MSFLPHQVPFTLLLYANTEKRQHKIKNETTKSNNTYKFLKSIVLNLISCVVIHRKKRCSQPLRGSKKSGVRHQIKLYNLEKSELKRREYSYLECSL